jgi:uncharacterized ferritin-like protein (DUF455 family)
MQIREFAQQIVLAETIVEKLQPWSGPVEDDQPGEAFQVKEPGRPENLKFAIRRTAATMPKMGALSDPHKRAVAHHIMANHELQALEVMAHVLCMFPHAPADFRRGMIKIMADEQRHTRMHIERAKKLGLEFGQLKVNCYIWKKSLEFANELDYLAGLPLVFEGANLDHTLEFATAFEQVGDTRSAALMRVIHHDEIDHVRFGMEWLQKMKDPMMTDFEAFAAHLHWPLRPEKARGTIFQREARLQAGMSEEFIELMENCVPQTDE